MAKIPAYWTRSIGLIDLLSDDWTYTYALIAIGGARFVASDSGYVATLSGEYGLGVWGGAVGTCAWTMDATDWSDLSGAILGSNRD